MKNIKPVVSVFKKKVNSFVKKSPPIGGPTLSPGKLEIMQYLRMLPYKFYTIESTDTQFLIFLAIWFLKKVFQRLSLLFLCKRNRTSFPIVAQTYTRWTSLNESTLSEDVSLQVTGFLAKWFSEKKSFNFFLCRKIEPQCNLM